MSEEQPPLGRDRTESGLGDLPVFAKPSGDDDSRETPPYLRSTNGNPEESTRSSTWSVREGSTTATDFLSQNNNTTLPPGRAPPETPAAPGAKGRPPPKGAGEVPERKSEW